MRKFFWILFLFFVFIDAAEAFTLSNFNTPESMIVDPDDGSYYVSNINGGVTDKDGNGYISKINSSGNIVIQQFIGGKKDELLLNAPKGMVILGKNLFVADIDTVKGFNKDTGKPSVLIDFSKFRVQFLNGIAVDSAGFLYVSDTLGNQIFKIDANKDYEVKLFKEGKELGGPNGLIVNPRSKNLMVVTWQGGEILEIDRNGGIHVLKKGLYMLDGIDYDNDGNLYVSSFEKGEIYQVAFYGRGTLKTFLNGLTTPGDISCDRKKFLLLIPSFKGDTVLTTPILKTLKVEK